MMCYYLKVHFQGQRVSRSGKSFQKSRTIYFALGINKNTYPNTDNFKACRNGECQRGKMNVPNYFPFSHEDRHITSFCNQCFVPAGCVSPILLNVLVKV